MKIFHISDLHIGKSIYGLSMLDNGDQSFWAEKFFDVCDSEKPDALLISGDIYDRSNPSVEAMTFFDSFLKKLSKKKIKTFIIAGNHDSGERLEYASSFLEADGIFISGVLNKELKHFKLFDEYGCVNIFLLPYIFPSYASSVFSDENIKTYTDAVKAVLSFQDIDFSERNIVLSHQNVVSAGKTNIRGGSETMIGGIGEVDSSVFEKFDYAALGHIHAGYPVGKNYIRYSGTPLCYHFDETKQPQKGLVEIILKNKGTEPEIKVIPVTPLHRMHCYSGSLTDIQNELVSNSGYSNEYVQVELTNSRITPDIRASIDNIFSARSSLVLDVFSSKSILSSGKISSSEFHGTEKSVEEMFASFYKSRFDAEPDENDTALINFVSELARNADEITDNTSDKLINYLNSFGGKY